MQVPLADRARLTLGSGLDGRRRAHHEGPIRRGPFSLHRLHRSTLGQLLAHLLLDEGALRTGRMRRDLVGDPGDRHQYARRQDDLDQSHAPNRVPDAREPELRRWPGRIPSAVALEAPTLVADKADLDSLLEHLAKVDLVAVDTESNSMHAYRERVCLVQLSFDGADYLVDPLAVDIAPLGDLFADPGVEKIFHAAEYDVMCLRRSFGFSFENLFDTMLAARILGWPKFGLGNILSERHGVTLNKRMQRHDWGRRPLTHEAIDYARMDTRFLEELRAEQLASLDEGAMVEEARAAFARVALAEATDRPWDPEGYWGIKGARHLDPEEAAILRALYAFRERLAERLDRPRFKIAGDTVLLAIAQDRPKNRDQLARIRGVPAPLVRRNARAILDAVRDAGDAEPPTPPPRPKRKPKTPADERFERLKKWRQQRASERGVEADVILGKRELLALADAGPTTREQLAATGALDAWQLGRYGDELLAELSED